MDTDLLNLAKVLDGMDHPVYVDWNGLDYLFDILKSSNWILSDLKFSCFFCTEESTYKNKKQLVFICECCLGYLKNQELDLIKPEDQVVSIKLRSLVCDWIDLNYFSSVSSDVLFGECKIKYNICHVCQQRIENNREDVAITDKAIAHYSCANEKGFQNLYRETDYNQILSCQHIENLISNLEQ